MANRFWVGGTATWDATAGSKWSTTSGGAGGSAIPTAADDVFFDSASGANTITLSSSSVARSVDCNTFTGTISHPASTTLTLGDGTAGAGNRALRLVSGMTYTLGGSASSAISFVSTSATVQTITTGTKVTGNLTFDGVAGSWQLADALTATGGTITLTNGTFDSNNFAVTCATFSSANTNTRVLSLGSSSWTVSGAVAQPWLISNGAAGNATALTLNQGTSTITITGQTAGGQDFGGGGKTYNNVVFNGPFRASLSFTSTFANLTFTGQAVVYNRFTFALANTISNTLTVTGPSTTNRTWLITGSSSGFEGLTRTITAAAVSLTNVDFQDVVAAGASIPWTGTSLGDYGGNSNITTDTPVTRYWVGNGGNWADTAHWSTSTGGSSGASIPLCHDTAIFDANSITSPSQTITVNLNRLAKDISFAAVLNTPTFALPATGVLGASMAGSLTMATGMTMTGTDTFTFYTRTTSTLTMSGVSFPVSMIFRMASGTMTLGDDLVCSSTGSGISLFKGTFNANGKNVTSIAFSRSNVDADALAYNATTLTMGSGTFTVTGTGAAWSISTNASPFTLNANTSTIKYTNASASSKTFTGAGLTYYNLWFSGAGSGTFIVTDSNTFNDFKVDTPPHTVNFTAGTTTTVTTITVSGTAGSLMTLQSTVAGTQWNISDSAGTNVLEFVSLQDSNATGGATFIATSSTIVSNNTGWTYRFSRTTAPARTAVSLITGRTTVRSMTAATKYGGVAGSTVTTASNLGITGAQAFSFGAWVQFFTPGDGNFYIPAAYRASSGSIPVFGVTGTGAFYFATTFANTQTVFAQKNTWYHMTQVYDGVSTHTFYIDAVAVGTRLSDTYNLGNGTAMWGAFSSSLSTHNGLVDEGFYTNYALTLAEIQNIKFRGQYPTSGLILLHRMNEGSGTSVADSSGSGFTGTLNGGAGWSTDVLLKPRAVAPARVTA